MRLENYYTFEGYEFDGILWRPFWRARVKNLVVTTGLNEIQKEFWTGAAYTAALYVGIINNASFTAIALTDTAAQINGTNGWKEFVGYSETVRQTLSMGSPTAGALDNSAMQAVFTVTSNFTLNGGFVCTSNVKSGTAGILIGAVSAGAVQAFTVGQQVRITISSTLSN